MKRTLLPVLLAGSAWLAPGAGAAQVDEAEISRQLDQVAMMLGLEPVEPAELEDRVEAIGGLSFRTRVPIDFMSRDELASYIRELFEEEYPPDVAEKEERALRAFGFLGETDDLRSIRERVLNENVAGFYDERPGVKKLFAISDGTSLNLMNQLILSHELRHALQDQHIVIRDKLTVDSDFDDRRVAALSLIEGDATVLMEHYLAHGVTKNAPELANLFQAFSQGLSGADAAQMFAGPALKDAPPIVQEQLIAPYFLGRSLAVAIHERGGFERLNASLEEPPRSMEQVLHPEKYLEGSDEPKRVRLPAAQGKKRDFEGTLGELYTRVLLENGPAKAAAAEAAAGWGGDTYAVVESGSGYELLWTSVWDTTNDAREFEVALRLHMNAFLGEDGYTLSRNGAEVSFERGGVR